MLLTNGPLNFPYILEITAAFSGSKWKNKHEIWKKILIMGERMTKVVLLFLSCKSTTSFFHLSQFLIVASRMEEAVVYRVNKFEISVETS